MTSLSTFLLAEGSSSEPNDNISTVFAIGPVADIESTILLEAGRHGLTYSVPFCELNGNLLWFSLYERTQPYFEVPVLPL
jgi:hypothetical protein